MRQVGIGDALAVAEFERLQLALGQYLCEFVPLHAGKRCTDFDIGHAGQGGAMRIGDREKALEIFLCVGAPTDREEVDDLNKDAGLAVARVANPSGQG
jgi:hypothetical protein